MKLKSLKFIFKPSFWLMNDPENIRVTNFINKALDNKMPIKIIDRHECVLNNKIIWISNFPYRFGTIQGVRGRPDRLTIERLSNELNKIEIS